jgi:hypothetical protein
MTETTRLAAAVGGTVGVPAVLIVDVLIALLQALPAFCPQPQPEPPAEKLKRLATDHPFAFRLHARGECRRQGVRRDLISSTVDELHRRALTEPAETLAAICAEANGQPP